MDPLDLPRDDRDLETEAHIALARAAAEGRASDGELRPIRLTDWPATPPTSSRSAVTTTTARPPAPGSGCFCGGAGWYKEAVPFGHPQFGKLLPCACKVAEQEALAQAAAYAHQQATLATLASDMGELGAKTFDAFDATWDRTLAHRKSLRAALATCRAWAEDPGDHWLFLTGPCGTGKSHLAAAAARELAGRGLPCYYRSVPELLNKIREGYQAKDFDQRLTAVCNVAVLVLDDLGAEAATASNRGLLFEIINHRALRSHLITIITSNADLAPFEPPDPNVPNLDPRVASRIEMRALVARVIADDYRALLGSRRQRAS